MKRKLLAGLLTLCMAAGMAVPAAAATTPAEQERQPQPLRLLNRSRALTARNTHT